MISLFSERPEPSQRPTSLVVSVLAHAGAVALLSFGIIYTPEFTDPIVAKRYSIRHLDLHTENEPRRQSAANGVAYPGPRAEAPNRPQPGMKSASHPAVMRLTADAEKGPQTLVQPDIPDPIKTLIEMPVPTVVIWTPKKDVVKTVAAPLPEKATASDVKPSVKPPNDEVNLGDIALSSTKIPTDGLAVFPTTTSPLVVHGPKMVQLAPVTTAQKAAMPTPTAVMSISDLRMPDGTATLPPVNQTTEQSESGILAPGQASAGLKSNRAGGAGKDEAAGNSGDANGVRGDRSGIRPGEGAGSGADDGLTTEHFTLTRNGQFGAIVVGASLEERFPEISGIWNDRVAYTVYLHVGLLKSWILQYSLPRNSDAALSGNITRLEAPWPYNIVRPNLAPASFNSDAILVHGFVNQEGRFESLRLAFPPEFHQAQFVLDALAQWQFRPAVQNGQTERVEVLLIIPEEEE